MPAKKGSAAPPQSVHVFSIKQWQENPDLQRKLRALLDDPTFQLAEATLTRLGIPGVEPSSKAAPGVSADAMNAALAHLYVHRSGYAYRARMLRFLATPKDLAAKPSTPYGDLLPEDE